MFRKGKIRPAAAKLAGKTHSTKQISIDIGEIPLDPESAGTVVTSVFYMVETKYIDFLKSPMAVGTPIFLEPIYLTDEELEYNPKLTRYPVHRVFFPHYFSSDARVSATTKEMIRSLGCGNIGSNAFFAGIYSNMHSSSLANLSKNIVIICVRTKAMTGVRKNFIHPSSHSDTWGPCYVAVNDYDESLKKVCIGKNCNVVVPHTKEDTLHSVAVTRPSKPVFDIAHHGLHEKKAFLRRYKHMKQYLEEQPARTMLAQNRHRRESLRRAVEHGLLLFGDPEEYEEDDAINFEEPERKNIEYDSLDEDDDA